MRWIFYYFRSQIREIAGYRDALNTVNENFRYIPLTPDYILQLHKIMFSHTDSAFGVSFKNVQNYIGATAADGRTCALFTPLAPYETPEAMRRLVRRHVFKSYLNKEGTKKRC